MSQSSSKTKYLTDKNQQRNQMNSLAEEWFWEKCIENSIIKLNSNMVSDEFS